jgi:hypothetical protein
MAVVSGVTEVPDARIDREALTDLLGDKTVAAMSKTFELDSGQRVLRQQEWFSHLFRLDMRSGRTRLRVFVKVRAPISS